MISEAFTSEESMNLVLKVESWGDVETRTTIASKKVHCGLRQFQAEAPQFE